MSRIRLHPSGSLVECAPGDTVLGALEKAGHALPNNCRAGACGECKTKVLAGTFDQGMVLDMALSPGDRAEGYGLMCMAKPLCDELVIAFGTADNKPRLFVPRENMVFVVVDKIVRTPRIVELTLRPLDTPMRYWPGQYVCLQDDAGVVPPRNYSIACAPRPEGEIVLQVSRQSGGVTSSWVHERLTPGERVRLDGAYGTFIGDPAVATPVMCLAAGSGLAPILALTEAALRRGFSQPVTLVFSARTAADIYERGLMAFWETRHRNFRFVPTLTRERVEGMHTGRIPALLPSIVTGLQQHSVFVAGDPDFVRDCSAAALALGVSTERLHVERFTPTQTPVYGSALARS